MNDLDKVEKIVEGMQKDPKDYWGTEALKVVGINFALTDVLAAVKRLRKQK